MRVMELWRYPVKSMLGERLAEAEVGPLGIEGDRQRAVVDAESGVSLSAKRYAQLLACRAWTTGGEVMIGLPDDSEVSADSSAAASSLSALLDRRVAVQKPEPITRSGTNSLPSCPPVRANPTSGSLGSRGSLTAHLSI